MDYRHVLDMNVLAPFLGQAETWLVCVSGGADSMCLLHAMHEMAAQNEGLVLQVIHVNHLVRGQAATEDSELVKRACADLGLAFHYRETAPLSDKPQGMTTEEFFRNERYAAIAEVAAGEKINHAVLGHTGDDLAESFLMHLMRGAGLRGLTFQFSQRKGSLFLLRPLWQTSRREVLKYLAEGGVKFHEDETNLLMDFTRNRVRNVLLPLMEEAFNPSVLLALRRTSRVIGGAQEFIAERAALHLRRMQRSTGDMAALPMRRLAALPDVLALEVIHQWLGDALGGGVRPSFEQSHSVLKLVRTQSGRRLKLSDGGLVSKSGGNLVALRAGARLPKTSVQDSPDIRAMEELARSYALQNPDLPLARFDGDVPIKLNKKDGGFSIQLEILDGRTLKLHGRVLRHGSPPLRASEDPHVPKVALPLVVRNRRSGDRVSPSIRLKSVLINDKVPYYIRDFLVVVADGRGGVLAVVGMQRLNPRLRTGAAKGLSLQYEISERPNFGVTEQSTEPTP